MDEPDCTLTRYWSSRVRILIEEVKELRASQERHLLANGGCVPKPAYDELGERLRKVARERDELLGLRGHFDAPE